MATQTPNYSFEKPTPGADDDIWGGFLNGNWDSVDTILQDLEDRLAVEEARVGVPIGTIMIWYSTIATIPTGWAWANGSTYTRTDGGGDIVSPDMRGDLIVGATGDSGTGKFDVGDRGEFDDTNNDADFVAMAYMMKI